MCSRASKQGSRIRQTSMLGLRMYQLVTLEDRDRKLSNRPGWLTVRNSDGNKQRRPPNPLPERRRFKSYIKTRAT